MPHFVLALFAGKVVLRIEEETRTNPSGTRHYDCYRVVFTDGTAIRFIGNSSADVECELCRLPGPPEPEAKTDTVSRNLEI